MGHRLDVDDLLKLKIKRLKSESEYLQNEMQEIQYVLVTEVMPLWSTEFGKYTKAPKPLRGGGGEESPSKTTAPKVLNDLFKKVAVKTHPDRGGDKKKFQTALHLKDEGDLNSLIKMAKELKIEIEESAEMIDILEDRIHSLKSKINSIKDGFPWVYYHSDPKMKKNIRPQIIESLTNQ